jgi:16S rRNA (adenine1518-N6/adenine1519-N6)-dimethyltransferase
VSAGGVRALLDRHGLRPRRDLGQNFLVDDALAERLVERAGVQAGDAVIEIGAGLGVLTRALAARAGRVRAVEVDAGLVRALRAEAVLPANVELIHADALELDLVALARELAGAGRAVRVVANLPYASSSPLLRALLAAREALTDWSVLLQREVALRIAARCGSRDYGSLAVLHALAARVERTGDLKPGCFHPRPKVVSTSLRIRPRADSPLRTGAGGDELERVERVARAAFGQRRKTLANALAAAFPPEAVACAARAAGVDPGERAERLPAEAFLALSRALESSA